MNMEQYKKELKHLEKYGCEYLEEVGYINLDSVKYVDETLKALETYYNKEFWVTTHPKTHQQIITEYKK